MNFVCCKYFKGGRNHYGVRYYECMHKNRSKIIEGEEKATLRGTVEPGYIKKFIHAIFGKPKCKPKRCILNDYDKDDYCPLFEKRYLKPPQPPQSNS